MLIDEFLPDYDFTEKHATRIRASAERVYAALDSTDLTDSWMIWGLFTLRGLNLFRPVKKMTLRDMTEETFTLLAEKPNEEIVLGLAGKFWTPTGNLQKVSAENFREFETKGFAKAAWNFSLDKRAENEFDLKTETRIKCLDEESLSSFRFYWALIRPFSGLIRMEMLRLIKERAESEN